ncbi:uncharacterized protein LOC141630160 [Silene latifolia]|uniref:uncharacterized protein LOC141630160 n=1 Tax=Silene latifolia TaxID=37657 RepID=UPI003D76CD0E
MCKGLVNLSGSDLQWFVGLPNKSISSFADLVNAFNQQFASSRKPEKQTSDLYRIVQGFEESTRDYLNRFNKEKVSIPRCDIATAIQAFRRGLHQDSQLYKELTMHPCTTFEEVQSNAILCHEVGRRLAPVRSTYDSDQTIQSLEGAGTQSQMAETSVRKPPSERHGQKVNTTRVNSSDQVLPSPPPHCSRTVNVITGGSELCGLTYSAAKRHATRTKGDRPESSCRVNHQNLSLVTFDETDAGSTPKQHHDALIITLPIGNSNVKKILVDTGSSVNLIMMETLKGMGFTEKDLAKKAIPLVGFSGETKHSLGEIIIPTYAGGLNKQVMYLVIDGPSTYNVILGRPWIHEMKAIPSTYHQCLKFPTPWGVQEIRGDQEEAKDCYKDLPIENLVNMMFKEQIGQTMEVYIDDMVVKSKQASQHHQHLAETFNTLRKYQMKLNPTKCTFGVSGGKFLG